MNTSLKTFSRVVPMAGIGTLALLLLISLAPGGATAAAPEFEQVLFADVTTVVLEHGNLVLRGLNGGGIIVHDRQADMPLDRWTSGQDLSGNFISDMAWTGQNVWISTLGGGMTRITDLNGNPDFRQYTNNLGDLNITAVTGTVIGDAERVFYGMDGKGVGQINSGLSGNIYTAAQDGLISDNINALAMYGTELFVGTPVGISRFANNAFTDQNVGLNPGSLVINDLLVDTAGNLLAGGNTGIYQWDPTGESWTLLVNNGSWIVDLASKQGKVYALGVTATGSGIAQVISEQHLPHPECVVKADHVDVVVERIHALDIETQRKFVLRAGAIDVLYLADQNEAIGMLDYPAAIGGEGGECFLPFHDVEADIDAEIVGTGIGPFLQQVEIDCGAWENARVCVPN